MNTKLIPAGSLIPGDRIVIERNRRRETERVTAIQPHDWTILRITTRTGDEAVATMELRDSDIVEVLQR